MKIALVKWVDSVAHEGWTSGETLDKTDPSIISTVGYVRRNTGSIVEIVGSIDPSADSYCGHILIPKIAVKSIQYLPTPKKKRTK